MSDIIGFLAGILDFAWAAEQAEGESSFQFFSWTLIAFFVGCGVGALISRVLLNSKVKGELGHIPGFERVNTVDKLIDKAYEYSKRPPVEEYEILKLNSEAYLSERGEKLKDVEFRQQIIDTVCSLGNAEKAKAYILEKMEGPIEDNERYGSALVDLKRYGCLDGYEIVEFPGRGRKSIAFGGKGVTVSRRDYPSSRERDMEDISRLVDERIGKALDDYARRDRRMRRLDA